MSPLNEEEKLDLTKLMTRNGVYDVLSALAEISGREADLLARTDASLAKRWDGLSNSLLMLAQRSVNL